MDIEQIDGAYFAKLLVGNMPWINRRVESIHILNRNGERRRVSLDINDGMLRDIARNHPLLPQETYPIPLGYLNKGLIADLDARDTSGHTLSVWQSNLDSIVAAKVIANGDPRIADNSLIPEKLRSICQHMPTQDDWLSLTVNADYPKSWDLSEEEQDTWSDRSKMLWRMLTTDPTTSFFRYLTQFTISYLPIVEIKRDWLKPVIKMETFSAGGNQCMEFKPSFSATPESITAIGRDAAFYKIRVSGDMEAAREHLRIRLPDGLEMASPPVIVVPAQTSEEDQRKIKIGKFGRTLSDRTIIYRTSTSGIAFDVVFGVRARMDGFAWQALLGLAIGCLNYLVLILIGTDWKTIPWDFDSSISLGDNLWALLRSMQQTRIALTPTAFTVQLLSSLIGSGMLSGLAVANDDQHARRNMLSRLRHLVVASTVLNALVGIATLPLVQAVPQSFPYALLAWAGCLGFGVVVSALVIRAMRIAKFFQKKIDADAGVTHQMEVERNRSLRPFVVSFIVDSADEDGTVRTPRPTLSWKVESDDHEWKQVSFESSLWDDKLWSESVSVERKAVTADSAKVPWPFDPLIENQPMRISIRVTSVDGETTEWEPGVRVVYSPVIRLRSLKKKPGRS